MPTKAGDQIDRLFKHLYEKKDTDQSIRTDFENAEEKRFRAGWVETIGDNKADREKYNETVTSLYEKYSTALGSGVDTNSTAPAAGVTADGGGGTSTEGAASGAESAAPQSTNASAAASTGGTEGTRA
ncbi:hypothetical protein IAU59_000266 [Kwoniella sp. CBS 9459]